MFSVNYRVEYFFNNENADMINITRYIDGDIKISLKRNAISTCSFSLKYRNIIRFLEEKHINLNDFMCEWFSTVKIFENNVLMFTGILDSYPQSSFSSTDTSITLTFQNPIGLTQGLIVEPVKTYHGNLNDILVKEYKTQIDNAKGSRSPLPLKVSNHIEQLNVVDWTVDNPMNMYTFLTQRCDNSQGSGNFDVYVNADYELEIWKEYGYNITDRILFQFGTEVSNIVSIEYPEWNQFYTDVYLSGAGNGYGGEGSTIVAKAYNPDSRKRHYPYITIQQDSSISTPSVLQAAATKYLKYTASPSATPVIKINATQLQLYVREHRLGGDLWVGDTVSVIPNGIFKYLPKTDDNYMRINEMEIVIAHDFTTSVTMTMIDTKGSEIKQ